MLCFVFFPLQGPKLLSKYHIKSFHMPGRCLEVPVDPHLYNIVKTGLIDLFGGRLYFGSKVLTPYCYTLGNRSITVVYLMMFSCSLPTKGLIFFFCCRCGDETWWRRICAACQSCWWCIQEVHNTRGFMFYTSFSIEDLCSVLNVKSVKFIWELDGQCYLVCVAG